MRQTAAVAFFVLVALLLARVGPRVGDWLRDGIGPPEPTWAPGGSARPDEGGLGPCGVRRVIDGDTLDVRCGAQRERVRMLRVDTPEREEPGYRDATRALRRLVEGRELSLVYETPGQAERGDHGRLLAYVYVDGENVNVEMVRSGWSRFFTRFGRGRFAQQFARAEREARDEGRGLWREP